MQVVAAGWVGAAAWRWCGKKMRDGRTRDGCAGCWARCDGAREPGRAGCCFCWGQLAASWCHSYRVGLRRLCPDPAVPPCSPRPRSTRTRWRATTGSTGARWSGSCGPARRRAATSPTASASKRRRRACARAAGAGRPARGPQACRRKCVRMADGAAGCASIEQLCCIGGDRSRRC